MSRSDIAQDTGLPPSDLILMPNFITPETQAEMVEWAISMRPHMKANGLARTFSKVQLLPTVAQGFRRTRMRLQKFLGIPDDAKPEPMFGWYVSVISDGGGVHAHVDGAPPDMRHLRCNLFLQLPEEGGYPIVEEKTVRVEERMMLAFFPSEKRHSSENVKGDRARVICSYGYLVPKGFQLPQIVQGMSYGEDASVRNNQSRLGPQGAGIGRRRGGPRQNPLGKDDFEVR